MSDTKDAPEIDEQHLKLAASLYVTVVSGRCAERGYTIADEEMMKKAFRIVQALKEREDAAQAKRNELAKEAFDKILKSAD